MSRTPKQSALNDAARLMTDYARRGVFRGYSQLPARTGTMEFKVTWHGGLEFDIRVDAGRRTIAMPIVLPAAPADLYADFKEFVAARRVDNRPAHRRIDKTKAVIRCARHKGNIALSMAVKNGNFAYALQRLIHLVHETFLIFLANGKYRDYKVARLGADPDWS